jgi:hypothetical protein
VIPLPKKLIRIPSGLTDLMPKLARKVAPVIGPHLFYFPVDPDIYVGPFQGPGSKTPDGLLQIPPFAMVRLHFPDLMLLKGMAGNDYPVFVGDSPVSDNF